MSISNQLNPTEKEKLLEYYRDSTKNCLLGVAIIFIALVAVEIIIRYVFPEITTGKIFFKNGHTTMVGALNQVVICGGGSVMILGVISGGYWHLKINDLLNEN